MRLAMLGVALWVLAGAFSLPSADAQARYYVVVGAGAGPAAQRTALRAQIVADLVAEPDVEVAPEGQSVTVTRSIVASRSLILLDLSWAVANHSGGAQVHARIMVEALGTLRALVTTSARVSRATSVSLAAAVSSVVQRAFDGALRVAPSSPAGSPPPRSTPRPPSSVPPSIGPIPPAFGDPDVLLIEPEPEFEDSAGAAE